MALEQFAIVFGAVLGFWTGFFTRDSTSPCAYMLRIAVNQLDSGQSVDRLRGGYHLVSSSFQASFWAWVGSRSHPHHGCSLRKGGSRRHLLPLQGSACVRLLRVRRILCSRYESHVAIILHF